MSLSYLGKNGFVLPNYKLKFIRFRYIFMNKVLLYVKMYLRAIFYQFLVCALTTC